MKVYHFAKTEESYRSILREQKLRPGRNVADPRPLVHLSLDPFTPGNWALDAMGPDTNKAWIFELEIPDDTKIEKDIAEEGEAIEVIFDAEDRAWQMQGET